MSKVPVALIRDSKVALRDVNRNGLPYLELTESIRKMGILNSVTVRECRDPETGELFYGLVDGLQRTSVARDLGLEEIPANILTMDDGDIMVAQIIANAHKIQTRPAEYAQQMVRIFAADPMMTLADMASKTAKSETWVSQQLSLVKLTKEIQELVNEGKVKVANAYALAKLPPEEQADFLDKAMTEQPGQFVPAVQNRVKEIRDARQKGRAPGQAEFVPSQHMRKISDIKTELESPQFTNTVILAEGCKTPEEGFLAALKWALHMDVLSVEEQKVKWEARKAQLEAEKAKRAAEREAKREAEAKAKQAELIANG